MRKYRLIAKKGEGTFSEVLKAQNVKDNKYHAIKCMKNHFESIDQVNNLREIQALRRLSPHQHVVKLEEVLYDQPSGRLALVFELMDANLYEMIRGRRHYLKAELIQSLMYQLVKALDHMHNKGIFHRDIKPENILVDDTSKLKLADFGSCRGIYSKQPYTEYISTRWYRAPECLLTDGYYGPEMDMWGAGCVFFEITSLYPLFPGANELDQIHRIHKILGTPPPDILEVFKRKGAAHVDFNFPSEDGTTLGKLIPHASAPAIDLMYKMLTYDPSKRLNAREALRHEYFKDLREIEDAQTRSTTQILQQVPLGDGGVLGPLRTSGEGNRNRHPAYGHSTLDAAGSKPMLKGKDESPELALPLAPFPSTGPSESTRAHGDVDDDDDDDNGELPPIYGAQHKAKASKNAALKQSSKAHGVAVSSTSRSKNGSTTNRSGIFQDTSTSKSKKATAAATGLGGQLLPRKPSQPQAVLKSKKVGNASSTFSVANSSVGHATSNLEASLGTLRARRK